MTPYLRTCIRVCALGGASLGIVWMILDGRPTWYGVTTPWNERLVEALLLSPIMFLAGGITGAWLGIATIIAGDVFRLVRNLFRRSP